MIRQQKLQSYTLAVGTFAMWSNCVQMSFLFSLNPSQAMHIFTAQSQKAYRNRAKTSTCHCVNGIAMV